MEHIYSTVGFILRHICRYRYAVSLQNLSRALPSASYSEVKQHHLHFYKNAARILIETVVPSMQQLHVPKAEQHMLSMLETKRKRIILLTGHYGNWEVLNKLPKHTSIPVQALYKPLRSKFWDKLFTKFRSIHGIRLLTASQALRILLREEHESSITLFIADQFPGKENGLSIDFLSQPTQMFTGAEQLARKTNASVLYLELVPVGNYGWKIRLEPICDSAQLTAPGFITTQYTRKLENSIRRNPTWWLWTHRRWK
ncbi:lysophospholipid acyltransferase family protein [Sphingobacterium psychroaquaticum]|uniref:KDO2-lipid IV(A) lauroyltransferase n=1 Tax=Sphingobacterium psychroaquaticum TaxID=561061 RepID=A0A1X7I3P3_9SPHI|nr:lysophospholipid acyltransferase family protein [Sphingobacterium psychroaquaticum]QBQ41952.1 hypothetical protein E2P86_12640 [Sphingobacterium psychroaquaticum]SMG09049.1 KDO2-lipid IV(A) lauroyltransferase [Sphingobacterium psychroaquaticum]